MHKLKYILTILAGIAVVGGTAYAASGSKPGDALFGLKKAGENVELNLVSSQTTKAQLQAKFAQERLAELNEIEREDQTQAGQANTSSDAQIKAKTEVSNAITQLTAVQAELQAKGEVQAAAAIGDTIARLQAKLTAENHGSDQSAEHKNGNADKEDQDQQGVTNDNKDDANKNSGDKLNEHCSITSVCGAQKQGGLDSNTNVQIQGGVHFDDGSEAEMGQ